MKCDCGKFFTKINDESLKILWCKYCGSIQIRHFAEDEFRPIMKPEFNALALSRIEAAEARFDAGHSYLMQVPVECLTVEDVLYSFGWTRDGLSIRID